MQLAGAAYFVLIARDKAVRVSPWLDVPIVALMVSGILLKPVGISASSSGVRGGLGRFGERSYTDRQPALDARHNRSRRLIVARSFAYCSP